VLPEGSEALRKAMDGAHSHEELRELTLQQLALEGKTVRVYGDDFNTRANVTTFTKPAAVLLPENPAEQTHSRVIYPHGNDRYEIFGASQDELNQKESRIRAAYGR
jgi:hypothetical protein